MSPFLTDVATTGCTAVPVSFDSCVSYLPCDGVGGGEFLVSCSSHWQNVSIRTQLCVWVGCDCACSAPRSLSPLQEGQPPSHTQLSGPSEVSLAGGAGVPESPWLFTGHRDRPLHLASERVTGFPWMFVLDFFFFSWCRTFLSKRQDVSRRRDGAGEASWLPSQQWTVSGLVTGAVGGLLQPVSVDPRCLLDIVLRHGDHTGERTAAILLSVW